MIAFFKTPPIRYIVNLLYITQSFLLPTGDFFSLLSAETSFGQGNIFTNVCHSVHRGGCLVRGGSLQIFGGGGGLSKFSGGGSSKFSGCLLRNAVNVRPVRIPLECILVYHLNLYRRKIITSFRPPI